MASSRATKLVKIHYPDLDIKIMEEFFLPFSDNPSLTVEEVNTVYTEHFSEGYAVSCIPVEQAKDEPFPHIVAHLVDELTEILPLEIDDIIKKDVPSPVIERCEELLSVISPLLTAARLGSSLQGCATGSTLFEFYAALCEEIDELICVSAACLPQYIRSILQLLHDVALYNTMKNPRAYDPTRYHRTWTLFLHELIKVVSVEGHCYKDGDRLVKRNASLRFNGMTDLGFKVKCGNGSDGIPVYKVIPATPDFIVTMNEVHQVGNTSGDGINLNLSFPILVTEVKTTYTPTSSYVEGQKMGSSSASGSSLRETPPSTSGTGKNASVKARKAQDVKGSSSEAMDVSGSQESVVTRSSTRKYSSSEGSNSEKQQKKKTYNTQCAETHRKKHLLTQHVVQLMGLLKWTTAILKNAVLCVKEAGIESFKISKNHASYGLFLLENRVYLTKMSVEKNSGFKNCVGDVVDFATLACVQKINNWGHCDEGQRIIDDVMCSTNYKIADTYLDIFHPDHLRALLRYLSIVTWHESKTKI